MAEQVEYVLSLKDLLTTKLHQADGAAKTLEGTMGLLQKSIGFLGVGFAIFKGGEFVKESLEKFHALEKATAQVRAGLESTKGAAGLTFQDVEESAKSLAKALPYSRTELLNMQSILLTFPSITKESFTPASEIIADMSTRLGQDLKSSAIQVGKALQDPIKGVTALRRVGVNFNEVQTEMIKKMVLSGHTAQAQQAIMKELTTEFGGSARAMAEVDPLFSFNKSMGAFSMNIGEAANSILETMKPALESIGDGFVAAGESVKRFFEEFNNSGNSFSIMKAIYTGAVQLITIFTDLVDTILSVSDAIATVVYAIKGATEYVATFGKGGQKSFEEMRRAWKNLGSELRGDTGKAFEEKALGVYEKHEKRDELFKDINDLQKAFQDGTVKAEDYNKSVLKLKQNLNQEFAPKGLVSMADASQYNALWSKLTKQPAKLGKISGDKLEQKLAPEKSSGTKVTTINISIGKLIESFKISTTNITEASSKIKEMVANTLISAVNDSQIIAGT